MVPFNNYRWEKSFFEKIMLKVKQGVLLDNLVIRKLVCRGISCTDNSGINFYMSCTRWTVCETSAFVREIRNLIPDKAFLSKYLFLYQLLPTKHCIE